MHPEEYILMLDNGHMFIIEAEILFHYELRIDVEDFGECYYKMIDYIYDNRR